MDDRVIPDIMNVVDILIRSVSERGVKKGGTWRTLMVPDHRHGGQGHP